MFTAFETYLRSRIHFTEEQFQHVKPFLSSHRIQKGKTVLHINDICQYICFVVKGCLRSYVVDDKGKEHIIQFAPENWWIAEQIIGGSLNK